MTSEVMWRLFQPDTPIVDTMGVAVLLNPNLICLNLLAPHREGDVNLASAWECSRNDVFEGLAVIVTAAAV